MALFVCRHYCGCGSRACIIAPERMLEDLLDVLAIARLRGQSAHVRQGRQLPRGAYDSFGPGGNREAHSICPRRRRSSKSAAKAPAVSYEDIAGSSAKWNECAKSSNYRSSICASSERLGILAPKGVLPGGPPGTGKTLLRALWPPVKPRCISIHLNGPENHAEVLR